MSFPTSAQFRMKMKEMIRSTANVKFHFFAMLLSVGMTPLVPHIGIIFSEGPKKEMVGINASADVTLMTDTELSWYVSNKREKGESMRSQPPASKMSLAISSFTIYTCSPKPTVFPFIYVGEKSGLFLHSELDGRMIAVNSYSRLVHISSMDWLSKAVRSSGRLLRPKSATEDKYPQPISA